MVNLFQEHKKHPLDSIKDAETIKTLKLMAILHRRKLLDLGNELKIRLHYGGSMSAVDILTFLYQYWMKVDPENPTWSERDRFVLSKGHAAPALYIALCMKGFFQEAEFKHFRRLGNILQGHPDKNKTPGVESCTGSLGQGFPLGCGMALAAKIDRASYRVYVLMSDGECNEGSVWEAALIASNLQLDAITVLLDWNRKSSYGDMRGRNDIEPLAEKWRAFRWAVFECNGHDFVSLSQALAAAERICSQPTIILCHTVKGKGIPYAEKHQTRSNFALTEEQYLEAIRTLEIQKTEVLDGHDS